MEIYITLGIVVVLFVLFFFYNRYYVSSCVSQKYAERETEMSNKIESIFDKYMGSSKRKHKESKKEYKEQKEQREQRDDSLEDPAELSNN
jgi:predicted Holliday junction resolvase-like endonuclease